MSKRNLLLGISLATLISSCANYNSPNQPTDTGNYATQPDSPTVNSREASSVEFPEENQH